MPGSGGDEWDETEKFVYVKIMSDDMIQVETSVSFHKKEIKVQKTTNNQQKSEKKDYFSPKKIKKLIERAHEDPAILAKINRRLKKKDMNKMQANIDNVRKFKELE